MKTVRKYPSKATVKGKVYFFILKNVFCRLVCWLWVKEIKGLKNIPRKTPFLIVCDHKTQIDFMFLTFAFRGVRFLSGFIKDAYFDIPWLNFFLRDLVQIRVDGKNGKESIDEGIGILKEGCVVVIFPEGTRARDEKLGKFHCGAGKIAWMLPDLPIVPVSISGIAPRKIPGFLSGRRVSLVIGKRMLFSKGEFSIKEITSLIRDEVENLRKG